VERDAPVHEFIVLKTNTEPTVNEWRLVVLMRLYAVLAADMAELKLVVAASTLGKKYAKPLVASANHAP